MDQGWAEPTRDAGLKRLRAFVPQAGRAYAERRNYDLPGHENVSRLSPWLRHRLVTEEEVLGAVLAEHGRDAAGKFVDEVFWRSYFKGWLEMRPTVWGAYWGELVLAWDQVQSQSGLRERWEAACRGETGIDCADHWARELVETGYLHNHARMWFASIWIFTLRLPWALGADFFLRHLLDGDPASNTLSWRWVAGLQTPGKPYAATASNIARFTEGRFRPNGLVEEVRAVSGAPNPDPGPLPEGGRIDPGKRSVLLLHEDDLSPEWLFEAGLAPVATGVVDATGRMSILKASERVQAFKAGALADCVARHEERLGEVTDGLDNREAVMAWAEGHGAEQIVTSYPPVGPVQGLLRGAGGVPIVSPVRDWDARAWPHATKGFFKFRERIPDLLSASGF
ncbi:FAD-binding domain-containing protein [Litorisediminicola beolgyonensis]|uniref:FAD-binding domain-containing protein n=1 Tax=Litorisediminicola beolgyonensis TaxID=1173614 RepID=A0ABW3ZF85_9RHOB